MNPEAVELIALCKEKGLTLASVESMTSVFTAGMKYSRSLR